MKKSILNIGTALSKAEQRSINGGSGECQVFWRDINGNAIGWSEQTDYDTASSLYHANYTDVNGNYVSGYCCLSCIQQQ